MSYRQRRSRAHTRHEFIRIARKRRRQFLELNPDAPALVAHLDLSLDRFDNEQPYLGCHHARCGLCHPTKRWGRGADRAADERGWRKSWVEGIP